MVSILHKEGVRVLLGTDSGYPGVLAGFSMHGRFGELQNLVGAGLSPYEARRKCGSHLQDDGMEW